ncbi:fasciclin domain-containing protein [Amycolatopsis sp. OK19-0408]|uniref:Fasciclin domain-containing protein n=1 Tax=Amycolatopsis iheyensis TaxID=2945988 RepID=A0A9X2NLS6_9PSEU|nr:fasciclin domain-containing protein [Amycolatopsis iheyensis]MCR6489768.1 fasciclin domain-containing protein [Amycolatopsis iheyensis]
MTKVRLAGTGLAVAAAFTLTACGSGVAASSAGAAVSMAPVPGAGTSGTPDGVTTDADVFGSACPRLPLASMGSQPVASATSANPLLTRLSAAVKAVGLVDTLNSSPAMTVFAPADPAFSAWSGAELVPILMHHVVGARYDAKGLATAGSVASLDTAGGPVKIEGSGENMTIGGAKILCGNIPTKNATVFVIDKVLAREPAG